jgi:hypothetical protein
MFTAEVSEEDEGEEGRDRASHVKDFNSKGIPSLPPDAAIFQILDPVEGGSPGKGKAPQSAFAEEEIVEPFGRCSDPSGQCREDNCSIHCRATICISSDILPIFGSSRRIWPNSAKSVRTESVLSFVEQ